MLNLFFSLRQGQQVWIPDKIQLRYIYRWSMRKSSLVTLYTAVYINMNQHIVHIGTGYPFSRWAARMNSNTVDTVIWVCDQCNRGGILNIKDFLIIYWTLQATIEHVTRKWHWLMSHLCCAEAKNIHHLNVLDVIVISTKQLSDGIPSRNSCSRNDRCEELWLQS